MKANLTENILAFILLILFSIVFGFIVIGLLNISIILAIFFISLTAGIFYFAGKDLLKQGLFKKKYWKNIFLIFIPIVLILDGLLFSVISWYNFIAIFPYYILFLTNFFKNYNKYIHKESIQKT